MGIQGWKFPKGGEANRRDALALSAPAPSSYHVGGVIRPRHGVSTPRRDSCTKPI